MSSKEKQEDLTAGVAFGLACASAQAYAIVNSSHQVRFPKNWSKIRRWNEIEQEEIARLLAEHGELAFENLRELTGDAKQRTALLRRRRAAGGVMKIELSYDMQNTLRLQHGKVGFIDTNSYMQEGLYRVFQTANGGFLSISFSWQGLAGPWVEEWLKNLKNQAQSLNDCQIGFEDLNEEYQKKIDICMNRIRLWENGKRVMDMILGQVGRQGCNPLEIPAQAFRILLWPQEGSAPKNWKHEVDSILTTLHAVTFSYETYKTQKMKGYGSFIGQWNYIAQGKGGHGEGTYFLHVQATFIGCLTAFENGHSVLKQSGKEAICFQFSKKILPKTRSYLGWEKGSRPTDNFITFDAGRSFYHSAAKLTPTQENLMHWVENNITRKRHCARKENKHQQVKHSDPTANEVRIYDYKFCKLLPPDKLFCAVLGYFKKNPETGFTLFGSSRNTNNHGLGLSTQMGYAIPPYVVLERKTEVILQILKDLKFVIVDYLEGLIIGMLDGLWISFENFASLPEHTLCYQMRIFLFLPIDWNEKRRAKWEKMTGRKVIEHVSVTTPPPSPPAEETAIIDPTPENGFLGWDLKLRLQAMMKYRKITQAGIAKMFGVSAPAVTYWLGKRPPEKDSRKNKPIPETLIPLIIHWIETGQAPSQEILENRKGRNLSVKSTDFNFEA